MKFTTDLAGKEALPKWFVEIDGDRYTTVEAPTVRAALEIIEREHGVGSVVEILPVVAGEEYYGKE